jgi:hypothetical protein
MFMGYFMQHIDTNHILLGLSQLQIWNCWQIFM